MSSSSSDDGAGHHEPFGKDYDYVNNVRPVMPVMPQVITQRNGNGAARHAVEEWIFATLHDGC